MPLFRCDACALRLYSAASATRCTECGAALGESQQEPEPAPLARPRLGRLRFLRTPVRVAGKRSPG
jgi:hypothetical protein